MDEKSNIKLFQSLRQELGVLETCIKQKAHPERILQILEAGCGHKWPINLSGVKYKIHGVDVDEYALKKKCSERSG